MNDIKIKVNGMEISLENSSPIIQNTDTDYDSLYATISKESEDLSKQIKAVSLLSDIKTVESFGYKATEGVMDTVKNAATTIWNKIIDFIKKIINFITSVVQGGIIKARARALLLKVKSSSVFAASADVKIEWPVDELEELDAYSEEAKKYLDQINDLNPNSASKIADIIDYSKRISSGDNYQMITIEDALTRLGFKAFKRGLGGDKVNKSFSLEVSSWLKYYINNSSKYIMSLRKSNELAKKALDIATKCSREEYSPEKAKAMQPVVEILNYSTKMYVKYVFTALSVLESVYAVQCDAKPMSEAYDSFIVARKKKHKNKLLLVAGLLWLGIAL